MRKHHLVIVTALVGAIAACLMIRTPDASATSESVTYIRPPVENQSSVVIAQAEAPEGEAAPAVEEAAPENDPVLNEALAQEQEPAAADPAPAKPLKNKKAFAQSPKSSRKAAAVKAKKSSKSKVKNKKAAKQPKKDKKKKAKKA